MLTRKKDPRYYVISLRVNNDELMAIKALLQREQTTISELMRDALQLMRRRLDGNGSSREKVLAAGVMLRRVK